MISSPTEEILAVDSFWRRIVFFDDVPLKRFQCFSGSLIPMHIRTTLIELSELLKGKMAHTSIPALRRQRQWDLCVFKAILVYTELQDRQDYIKVSCIQKIKRHEIERGTC